MSAREKLKQLEAKRKKLETQIKDLLDQIPVEFRDVKFT